MYIVTGQKPYGTCDVVPELFYVSTVFFHVNYIPLIPVRSMIILEKKGENIYGVNIPMSLKSVLLAWLRVIAFLTMVIAGFVAFFQWEDHRHKHEDPWALTWLAIAGALAFLILMLLPRRKTSYTRAVELGKLANLSPQAWAALNVMYGRDPLDGAINDGKDLLRPTEMPKK